MKEETEGRLGPGPCPKGPGERGEPGILESDVLVEYRGSDGQREIHNTAGARLFVDPSRNRLGVRGPGSSDGEYYVPLSEVLALLKKGVL